MHIDIIPQFIKQIEDLHPDSETAELLGLYRIEYYHGCQQRLWHDYGSANHLTAIVIDAYPTSDNIILVAAFDDGKRYEEYIENGPNYFDILSSLQDMILKHSGL